MSNGPARHSIPNAPRRLSDEQRVAWLRLIRSENVGPVAFRQLVNHYGSAAAAVRALPKLSQRGGARKSIQIFSEQEARDELASTRRIGGEIVALGEVGYPPLLRHVDAPPPLLSVRGSLEVLSLPALSIVGGRNASLAGRKFATKLASEISAEGYTIVSGLALGIDGAAHRGALEGGTVAVFASGIDKVYPRDHRPLMEEIFAAGGAAVTEMPFGWEPRPRDFPRRNRLISGMSLAVILVEAAERSGSLHTARFAADQGRDVLAVPGSPLDPRVAGCNALIRDGAALIRSSQDVFQALEMIHLPHADGPLPEMQEEAIEQEHEDDPPQADRDLVIQALGPTPVSLDELIRETKVDARSVQIILIELELAGRLERHSRNLVSLVL